MSETAFWGGVISMVSYSDDLWFGSPSTGWDLQDC